jgi:hypothetical protein
MFGGRGLSMPPAAYHLRKRSFDVPTTFSRNIVIVKRDVFMMHLLKRHPIPIVAWFEDSLVLTYALPRERLRPLLPPGLELDGLGDFGFLAVALVQTRRLRPAGFPAICGQDFFLGGYRIFARFTTRKGRRLRGLRILRSDTSHRRMACAGNRLTHYNYQLAKVRTRKASGQFEVEISTFDGRANLHVIANLAARGGLPLSSPFRSVREARLFAGPLPFTFDYEPETHSMILIEGVREHWSPELVSVDVLQNSFLEPFADATPILASAFHVGGIPYRWKRGVREPLNSHEHAGIAKLI